MIRTSLTTILLLVSVYTFSQCSELTFFTEFDDEFIDLARSVYITNDERAKLKNNISLLFNSDILEVKSYKEYN